MSTNKRTINTFNFLFKGKKIFCRKTELSYARDPGFKLTVAFTTKNNFSLFILCNCIKVWFDLDKYLRKNKESLLKNQIHIILSYSAEHMHQQVLVKTRLLNPGMNSCISATIFCDYASDTSCMHVSNLCTPIDANTASSTPELQKMVMLMQNSATLGLYNWSLNAYFFIQLIYTISKTFLLFMTFFQPAI